MAGWILLPRQDEDPEGSGRRLWRKFKICQGIPNIDKAKIVQLVTQSINASGHL